MILTTSAVIGPAVRTTAHLQNIVLDKLITIAPRSVTNTTFTIKGNKKKLDLIKGSNSARLVVNGISSNMGSFMF